MSFDDCSYVWHTTVGYLYCVLVKDLVQLIAFPKAFMNNFQELSAHTGFDVFVVGWVEPDDVAFSLSFPCLWCCWSNIVELVNISTIAQRLLINGGCFFEDFKEVVQHEQSCMTQKL